jgi:hypothetical protein
MRKMTDLEKTRFMNRKTFSEDEIKNYPYNDRRVFCVGLSNDLMPTDGESFNNLEVYAVDETSLFEYLKETYDPDSILAVSEKITDFIEIDLSDYL